MDDKKPSPLSDAVRRLNRLKALGVTEVLVSYSGGKDSEACLDLCKRLGFDVTGFFYRYAEFECEERLIKAAETRHRIKIHRLPHPGLSALLRSSTLRRRDPLREATVPKIKPTDLEAVMRRRTGIRWIVLGHRKNDSLQRRGMLSKCDCHWAKFGRIYPLCNWVPKDVIEYLESRQIPLPPSFGTEGSRNPSGVSLTHPPSLVWVRDNWPEDWKKLVKLFPMAPTLIARDEVRKRHDVTFEPETKVRKLKDSDG